MTARIQLPDKRRVTVEKNTVLIGADANCDVQLEGLEPQHARLRRMAGRWMIESQGDWLISTGSSQAGPSCWVQAGDVIHLKPSGPSLIFEPHEADSAVHDASPSAALSEAPRPALATPAAAAPAVDQAATTAHHGGDSGSHNRSRLPLAAGLGSVLLIAVLLMLVVRGPRAGPPVAVSPQPTSQPVVPPSATVPTPEIAPVTARPVELSKDERIFQALYLVLVRDAEGKETYRVGTAWAVEPNRLVTSASVLRVVEELRDRFPQARLFSPSLDRELDILSTEIHPQYTQADQAFALARNQYESLLREFQTREPPVQDMEAAHSQLVRLQTTALEALEEKSFFDVALIRTAGTGDSTLPLNSGGRLRPKQKLEAIGLAFDAEDPFFDAAQNFEPSKLVGRVRQVVVFPQRANASRVQVESDARQLEENFLGSPVLDASGQVVALYTRPTPSSTPDQQPPGDTYDALTAEQIGSLLSRSP